MIETKFKESELGPIPKDWCILHLGEIASIKTGPFGSALHAADYVRNGTPIITVEHLGVPYIVHSTTIPLVSLEDKKRLKSYILQEGDIVYSRVGSVDRNSIVTDKEDGWLFSGRLLRVRKQLDYNSFYLGYHLNSFDSRRRIIGSAVGLGMPSINTQILGKHLVLLPSKLIEQERIADALTDIDMLIAELSVLIEKKRAVMTATMQDLLTARRRLFGFSEPWKTITFGDILAYEQPSQYIVSSTVYSKTGTPVLTAGKTFILGYTTESHGIFNKTPTIIFDDFTTDSKFVNFSFKVKSSAVKMLSLQNKDCDLKYIFYLMQIFKFHIVEHKRHWIAEYSKECIKLPSLSEQQAITSILSDMEVNINELIAKRDKYVAIRQGMMQQLLTGKIRLI